MKFSELYKKYQDLIPYAVFGVLTTLVNLSSYWVISHILHAGVMTSTVIAWILSVLFAYITNRKWVFHSENTAFGAIVREVVSFFGCRLATGIIDWLCMFVFVEKLHFNDMVIKIAANVIVIICNYVASKLFIFKKQ